MRKLLKSIREANGLSQKEMGIILHLGSPDEGGQSFLSQIEGGRKPIPLRVMYKLPRVFKLTKEQLKAINDYLDKKV